MAKSYSNLTKNERLFIQFVKKECKTHGITCSLRDSEYLNLGESIKCSGYFDEANMVLAVATKRKDWLEILVHEYCHLTQWVENCPAWKKVDDHNSCTKMHDWLSGKRIKNAKFHLSLVRDLEFDNEKRAVKTIKEFGLDNVIDVDHYIRKANAYVSFYNYLKYTRKWSNPNNSPYSNEELISKMPKTFRVNHKKLSKRTFKAFLKSGM